MAVTTGTPGADTLTGTSAADTLGGQAGNDRLSEGAAGDELHLQGIWAAVRQVDGFNFFQSGKSFIAVAADITTTVER